MRALASALLSVVLGLTIAVATPAHGWAQEEMQEEAAEVHVHNETDSHAWVYVLQGGHMVPLDLVPGMENATMRLPPTYGPSAEPIQLVADFLDSAVWSRSDPVSVDPGERVQFTIEHDRDATHILVND